ncbi:MULTISPECIES: SUMF1/EgtB/PvdO family nonheme iron enzyme [unclassified Hyphomonas]|uniref:SUMF1/EgtB/PvdO family nonheme iron enzyme n=1 Tax=unclassified Hyphomonas TaxID=2630699 RepID=UPI0009DE734E|nr:MULTISPECIES: SUMF1/EgtB/PvdO family nonheme iron enzyme [unclassified Hyphomonas]
MATACSGPSDQKTSSETCGLAPGALGTFISFGPGSFDKGKDPVYPEESPPLTLHIDAFDLLSHEVTNAEFARFVEATGYVTDAERSAAAGGVGAGSAVFQSAEGSIGKYPWKLVSGATWKSPEGPGSSIAGRERHPVVHVSLADAHAYAEWADGRLPTEAEWEYAASLGLPDPARSNSGAYTESGGPIANTWQGIFPIANTGADGFKGTSPVGCFGPDKAGMFDMIGNVWEWTDTPYGPGTNTIKGGSYLCAENFCRRYRPAARQPEETDFSSNHIGFRIARDVQP